MSHPVARMLLIVLNTIGLALYIYWLATREDLILYSTAGVLYLLPCVPFIFVLIAAWHGNPVNEDEE
ncbi:MAG: hypothetical protein H7A43_01945 [Verrucomicrobia bacterium]|nr:hypothetical protein [Kiritimatiellia bacterium]MCB1101163.1 hypothetical protein [Kiritimatiellia bacterium]MCP5487387.1 hypothetical protein [Verrucomicrobiota bacterium]